jgi:single-strand DNA-binding protein
MNKVVLMGRLTRDPEVRETANNVSVATFTLAVDRRYKDASGERQADFINIVAWRHTAEFIGKYCSKGTKLVIAGSIQTRTYDDKDGKRVYVTEVIADEVEFAESKRQSEGDSSGYSPDRTGFRDTGGSAVTSGFEVQSDDSDDFVIKDEEDVSLPFDV